MQRGGVRRVADAEADHEHALRTLDGEQGNVGQRTHVALDAGDVADIGGRW